MSTCPAAPHVAADEHLHAGLFTLVGVNVDQFHDEIGIRGRKPARLRVVADRL